MSNAGSSSLRDLYSTPPTSWAFVPTASNNGSSSSTAPGSALQPMVSEPSYQWATRPKQNSIMDLSPGLRMEPGAPNVILLLKAACASAVLHYASGAVEMPWEVARTLLQVQYVPRDAKAAEDLEEESEVEIISDESSAENDEAYFADDADSSPRTVPARPTDERGYVVRQNVSDPTTRPEYTMPLGAVNGVWHMIKQIGRWKPEGWFGLWKGLLTSCIRDFLSATMQPVIHTVLSSLLSPVAPSPGMLTFAQRHPVLLPVLSHLLTGFILSPLDLIRTRLMVQSSVPRHRTYTGPLDAFSQITQFEGGVKGMYLHPELLYPTLLDCTLTPLIATTGPRYAAHFLSHKLRLGSLSSRGARIEITDDTNPSLWALAQLLGGCAGLIVTLPVETIRRRLQIQTRGTALPLKTCVETRPKRYVGIVDAIYSILSEERSDLPLKPTKKRRGKKHRRSISSASDKGKEREGVFVEGVDGEEDEGNWLSRTGVGQLYRGLGMRLCASLMIFALELMPTPAGIDDGWTEL